MTGRPEKLTATVAAITDALFVYDDLRAAFGAFDRYVNHPLRNAAVSELVQALGKATAPPPGVIHVGIGILVFGNPYRDDHAWRCGTCQPCVGVNYDTFEEALSAAIAHAGEHTPNLKIEVIERTAPAATRTPQ